MNLSHATVRLVWQRSFGALIQTLIRLAFGLFDEYVFSECLRGIEYIKAVRCSLFTGYLGLINGLIKKMRAPGKVLRSLILALGHC